MPFIELLPIDIYKERRAALVKTIQQQHKGSSGSVVVLFSNFETDGALFRQERSFLYFTGIDEPATALVIDVDTGKSTLFVPNFGAERAKWVDGSLTPSDDLAQKVGVDDIVYLGAPCKGYQCQPFFTQEEYGQLVELLQSKIKHNAAIFTINPNGSKAGYVEQRFIVQRLSTLIPSLTSSLIDISSVVAQLRRHKNNKEIEYMFKAIDITVDAHEMVAKNIKPELVEYEMQAIIEYVFTLRGGSIAFPSIVASGSKSTILHYIQNAKAMQQGELVVIDIGAQYNHYCADLTRTYPVSGTFSKRQREVYDLVLETQDYVANLAKPGMWLSNAQKPEHSLHHLAQEFLRKKGYDKYFNHGIGHFLGLDVHDVGDYTQPLQAGDVITIEPGIYIPQEQLGIRIEDNYWIVPDGAICLSENLARSADDIELMMQERSEQEEPAIDMESMLDDQSDDLLND